MSDGLAAEANATPDEIADLYDEWAQSDYDDDVAAWGYEAPERVAEMVATHVRQHPGEVLDAGCGTGRVGEALRHAGVPDVIGGDFSEASNQAARARGVYQEVAHLDLNGPLTYATDRFTATVSVGVFSYVTGVVAALRELIRITKPGGVVIFTQRTDLWAQRNCDAIIESLVSAGQCRASMTDPMAYLPQHPEFADQIGIIYTTLEVR